ncbi:MAG: patatin-like phospholipase family protein [Verrucomicrobia bacterium]|nr:patatin-like phospholipase family protein [Verrucomicrobiota bacterium]
MKASGADNAVVSTPQSIIKALTEKKVALVLAGGGFKGSYQIGVWKALKTLGINNFVSVAGTSVGALNAIFMAADDLESAERIWCDKDMMTWSVKSWGTYAITYILLLVPFLLAFISYGVLISALPGSRWNLAAPVYLLLLSISFLIMVSDKMRTKSKQKGLLHLPFSSRFWSPFFGAVVFVGCFAALGVWFDHVVLTATFEWWVRCAWALVVSISLGLIASSSLGPAETNRILHLIPPTFLFNLGLAISLASVFTILCYFSELTGAFQRTSFLWQLTHNQNMVGLMYVSAMTLLVAGICGGMIIGSKYGLWLTKCFRHSQKGAQLFSNAEILTTIQDQLDFDKIKARVRSLFVTIARARTFLDPFKATIKDMHLSGNVVIDETNPGTSTTWVPEYYDINTFTDKQRAIEVFRLTSALPMIFRMGLTPKEEMLVDGGLVDNVPVTPVLDAEADIVLVLLLDDRGLTSLEAKRHINRTWRLWRTPNLTQQAAQELYLNWRSRQGVITMDQEEYTALKTSGHSFVRRALNLGGDTFDLCETDYAQFLPKPFEEKERTLIVIAPRKPLCVFTLGPLRFITGTLNFILRYRRRWLRYGFEETMAALTGKGERCARLSVIYLPAKVS